MTGLIHLHPGRVAVIEAAVADIADAIGAAVTRHQLGDHEAMAALAVVAGALLAQAGGHRADGVRAEIAAFGAMVGVAARHGADERGGPT